MNWTEADSAAFLDSGEVLTPRRADVRAAFLDLIPARPDESFLAVDIGIGGGWLSAAVLEQFPNARLLAVDGSPAMLEAAAEALSRFRDRVELRPFRLEDPSWLEGVEARCFLSSLVIHHLHGPDKRALFRALLEHLEPGGALLVFDLIAATGPREEEYLARMWDETVRRQSWEMTGGSGVYDAYLQNEWNIYRFPDPMDRPSPLPDQLDWLREMGYEHVDAFRVEAGHALYGGYRPDTMRHGG